jgi:hypothetical protein
MYEVKVYSNEKSVYTFLSTSLEGSTFGQQSESINNQIFSTMTITLPIQLKFTIFHINL